MAPRLPAPPPPRSTHNFRFYTCQSELRTLYKNYFKCLNQLYITISKPRKEGLAKMAGNDELSGESRTMLWCVPRSGSTALTKCLSFIDGIEVWFEPYNNCRSIKEYARQKLNLHLPPDYCGNEEKFRQAADAFDELCRCKSNPEYFS